MNYLRLKDELINLDKVAIINFIGEDFTIEFIFDNHTKYYKMDNQDNYNISKTYILKTTHCYK